jgi:hypothetical protein
MSDDDVEVAWVIVKVAGLALLCAAGVLCCLLFLVGVILNVTS